MPNTYCHRPWVPFSYKKYLPHHCTYSKEIRKEASLSRFNLSTANLHFQKASIRECQNKIYIVYILLWVYLFASRGVWESSASPSASPSNLFVRPQFDLCIIPFCLTACDFYEPAFIGCVPDRLLA